MRIIDSADSFPVNVIVVHPIYDGSSVEALHCNGIIFEKSSFNDDCNGYSLFVDFQDEFFDSTWDFNGYDIFYYHEQYVWHSDGYWIPMYECRLFGITVRVIDSEFAFREYVECMHDRVHALRPVTFVQFDGYGEYLQAIQNQEQHSLNGNIDCDRNTHIVSIRSHYENMDCTFDMSVNDLRDDKLLLNISKSVNSDVGSIFKLSCYYFVQDYLMVPYLLNLPEKLRSEAALGLYFDKMKRFGITKSCSSLKQKVNNYIVLRFKYFVRNVLIRDSKGLFYSCVYRDLLTKLTCKSQMLGGLFDPEKFSKIQDTINKSSEMMSDEKLSKVDSIITKLFSGLTVVLENPIVKMVAGGLDSIASVVESIKNILDDMCKSVASTFGVEIDSPIVKIFFSLMFCLSVIAIILSIGTITTFVCELVRLATGLFFGRVVSFDNSADAQMNVNLFSGECVSQMAACDVYGSLFIMGIYLCTGAKIDAPNFVRNITGWGGVLGSFCEHSKTFINTALKKWFDIDIFMEQGELPELTTFVTNMIEICYTVGIEDKVRMDQRWANKIIDLYKDLARYKKTLLDVRIVKVMNQTQINIAMTRLEDLYQISRSASPDVHDRIEPGVIALFGEEGQGKSSHIEMLPEACYNCIRNSPGVATYDDKGQRDDAFRHEYSKNLIYARDSNENFWSKWSDNPILLYDEMCAGNDDLSRQKECKEFLKVVGRSAMPLEAASVNEKGTNFMTSKMVFTTSNCMPDEFHRMGLTKPSAFVRRLHFPLIVKTVCPYDPLKRNWDEAWSFTCIDFSTNSLFKRAGGLALSESGLVPRKVYRFSEIVNLYTTMMVKRLSKVNPVSFKGVNLFDHIKDGVFLTNTKFDEERVIDGVNLVSQVYSKTLVRTKIDRKKDNVKTETIKIEDGVVAQSQMKSIFSVFGKLFKGMDYVVDDDLLFKRLEHEKTLISHQEVLDKKVVNVPNSDLYINKIDKKNETTPEITICKNIVYEDGKISLRKEASLFLPHLDIIVKIAPCWSCIKKTKLVDIPDNIQGHLLALMMENKYWRSAVTYYCRNEQIDAAVASIHRCVCYVFNMFMSMRQRWIGNHYTKCYVCECHNYILPEYKDRNVDVSHPFRVKIGSKYFSPKDDICDMFGDKLKYYTHIDKGRLLFELREFVSQVVKRHETSVWEDQCTMFVTKTHIEFVEIERKVKFYFAYLQEGLCSKVKEFCEGVKGIVGDIWDFIVETCSKLFGFMKEGVDKCSEFCEKTKTTVLLETKAAHCYIVAWNDQNKEDKWSDICSFTKAHWAKMLALVSVVCCVGYGFHSLFSNICENPVEHNMIPFKKNGVFDSETYSQSYTSRYKQEIARPSIKYARLQMSVEDEMREYEKIVMKNSRIVEIKGKDGRVVTSNIFFVNNVCGVITNHFYRALDMVSLSVCSVDGSTFTSFAPYQLKLTFPKDRDCVFVKFELCQRAKNIISRLMDKPKHSINRTIRLMKGKMGNDIAAYFATGDKATYCETDLRAKVQPFSDVTVETKMKGYYEVSNGGGFDGACSFPVLSKDPSDQNKPIMGIHVAQRGANSIVCPIFSSDFVEVACSQMYTSEDPYEEDFTSIWSNGVPGVGSFFKPVLTYSGATETAFVKSNISQNLPEETLTMCPAKLKNFMHNGEVVKPMNSFYKKYLDYESWLKPKILHELENEPELLWEGFEPKINFVHSWLTIEEAIFGAPDKGIESMEGNSSPGFKYNKIKGMNKRNKWWNLEKQWIHPDLKLAVVKRIIGLKCGIKYSQVVIDALKDELRDAEKVALGKTRLFCVGELVACIVTKMFMGTYIQRVKKERGLGSCAVGTNPHGSDWTYLGRDIFKFGRDRVIGGDLPTMDVSTQRYLYKCAYRYLKRRMNLNKQEKVVLDGILYNIVTTIHVSGSWSYIHEKGNSSGNWMTTWFNSFCCYTYISTCFYWLRPPDRTEKFRNCVALAIYGDDNLGSVWGNCDWFDNIKLSEAMKELFGLALTDPNKGAITSPWLKEEHQIFLSRKFVEKDGEFLAPLEKESLFGMLHWVRHHSELRDDDQLMQNVDVFASEMSHYGIDEGNALWKVVCDAMQKSGIQYEGHNPKYWRSRRHLIAFQCYEYR